ncbi:MAG: hypothetical protein U0325_23200 [Polyangiales bacterium]
MRSRQRSTMDREGSGMAPVVLGDGPPVSTLKHAMTLPPRTTAAAGGRFHPDGARTSARPAAST